MSSLLAPDTGTLIEYEGHKYRVDAWMKERDIPEPIDIFKSELSAVFQDIIDQSNHVNDNGKNWVWCVREEATHLSCSGVSGCIVPVKDAKVVGRVSWSEEAIDDHRKDALSLVGEVIF